MKKLSFLIFAILLLGCSQKEFSQKEQYLITIKSKDLKFSDIGYISKNSDSVLVDIFSLGNQVLKFEMGNFISINGKTPILYSMFNAKFLDSTYPSQIIKNIFLGKPIFRGKNLEQDKNSFSQNIGKIIYRVSKNEIYFRDVKNSILIRIRLYKKETI